MGDIGTGNGKKHVLSQHETVADFMVTKEGEEE
jgi:hypothetical protein